MVDLPSLYVLSTLQETGLYCHNCRKNPSFHIGWRLKFKLYPHFFFSFCWPMLFCIWRAVNVLAEMRSTLGLNDCKLLCINSSTEADGSNADNSWLPYVSILNYFILIYIMCSMFSANMQSAYSFFFQNNCRKHLVWTIVKEPVSLAWMIWMRYYNIWSIYVCLFHCALLGTDCLLHLVSISSYLTTYLFSDEYCWVGLTDCWALHSVLNSLSKVFLCTDAKDVTSNCYSSIWWLVLLGWLI